MRTLYLNILFPLSPPPTPHSSSRTHTLRVTVETTQAALSNIEEERETFKEQIQDLQSELITLKRDNDKAKEMRSLALEERSKVS